MNEEAAKIIGELSKQLGTTAENLWDILIIQSKICRATPGILILIRASRMPLGIAV